MNKKMFTGATVYLEYSKDERNFKNEYPLSLGICRDQ